MPDLSHFLGNAQNADDIGSSNGFAGAAGGGGAGGLSMEQRKKRNENRIVGEYKWSELGNRHAAQKAKTADQTGNHSYDASTGSFTDDASYSSHQRGGKVEEATQPDEGAKRDHFIEPPSRNYDKYA